MKIFVEVPEIFLYRDMVDFRKSINEFAGIVKDEHEHEHEHEHDKILLAL